MSETTNCPGAHRPFVPDTLSRDGEVARCSVCGDNYYVTDTDVIEPHPVHSPSRCTPWWRKIARPRCLWCLHTVADHDRQGCTKCLHGI